MPAIRAADSAAVHPRSRSRPAAPVEGASDRWQVIGPWATGGWAEILLVRPASHGGQPGDYLLKRPRRGNPRGDVARAMIRREAAVARAVSSPHVIPVLDHGALGDAPYNVLPRLRGVTLRGLLDGDAVFSGESTLRIGRQMAAALAALHTEGWLHGDLRPENVFVGPSLHVTVIDLGLARRTDEAAQAAVFGEPRYLAPEQLTPHGRESTASEMYSLGRILGEFAERTVCPGGKICLQRLIERLTAAEPLRRPSATEAASALAALAIERLNVGHSD